MSSRITYGKKGRRLGTGAARLQPAVEFSPKKENNITDRPLTTSSSTQESDNAPLTSPFNSPTKRAPRKEITPDVEDQGFDFGVFDLEEDDVKPAMPKKVNRTRTKLKKVESKNESTDTIPRSPSASLGSFFVESSAKPTWSPSKSTSASPKKDNITLQKSPTLSSPKKINNSKLEPKKVVKKSPKRPLKLQDTETAGDVWDLLSDIPQERPKKKTMVFKEKDVEMTDLSTTNSNTESQENELISFFNTQQTDTQPDDEPNTPAPEETQLLRESTASPRISRTLKTYGLQRSFLLEKQNQDAQDQLGAQEEHDITLTSEQDQDNAEGLKTISNLRAQGENAQFLDELNFIVEGIETPSSTTSSLLELALRLFDNEFLNLLKHHGLPTFHQDIDADKLLQVFVFGFIACKVLEGGNGKIMFDDQLVHIVKTLLSCNNEVEPIKESRATKAIFKEFKDKLGGIYTPAFLGLTLLIQNNLFVNTEIFETLIELFMNLNSKDDQDIKMINMILLLFESFLGSTQAVDDNFKKIVPVLLELNIKDQNCRIALLKVLIVLSVKKFEPVFSEVLVDRSIEGSIQNSNTSVGLLELGLLINLVEKDACCKRALNNANLKRLYRLQSKLQGESKDYYALLIGIMLTKFPHELKNTFHKDDITEIASHLQNFNSKGNTLISLQVEEIVSKMHKLKIII